MKHDGQQVQADSTAKEMGPSIWYDKERNDFAMEQK